VIGQAIGDMANSGECADEGEEFEKTAYMFMDTEYFDCCNYRRKYEIGKTYTRSEHDPDFDVYEQLPDIFFSPIIYVVKIPSTHEHHIDYGQRVIYTEKIKIIDSVHLNTKKYHDVIGAPLPLYTIFITMCHDEFVCWFENMYGKNIDEIDLTEAFHSFGIKYTPLPDYVFNRYLISLINQKKLLSFTCLHKYLTTDRMIKLIRSMFYQYLSASNIDIGILDFLLRRVDDRLVEMMVILLKQLVRDGNMIVAQHLFRKIKKITSLNVNSSHFTNAFVYIERIPTYLNDDIYAHVYYMNQLNPIPPSKYIHIREGFATLFRHYKHQVFVPMLMYLPSYVPSITKEIVEYLT